METELELIINLLVAIVGLSGVIGAFIGIREYREGRIVKRKEILFPLIEEFDDETKLMDIAKNMLDGFKFRNKGWEHPIDYYGIENLKIFRHHKNDGGIDDIGEIDIRNGFDALLDFFGKLGYLLTVKLINEQEMEYFRYYIEAAAKSQAVKVYTSNYNFKLYENLLEQLGIKPI